MTIYREFVAWLDSLFGFGKRQIATLQTTQAPPQTQAQKPPLVSTPAPPPDNPIADVVNIGKLGAAAVGAGTTIAGGVSSIITALGSGAAPVVAAPAATIAAPGAVSALPAVAAAPAAAVAVSVVAVAAVAALLTMNVVMMFQSLFGDSTPPEPQRRAAFNTQMGALYNSPYLTGQLDAPPYMTNADDTPQVQAAFTWLTNARRLLVQYGRENDFTYLAQQALLASADVGINQAQQAADISGTTDLRREF